VEVLVSSASRGLAPREGLELLLLKLGHTRPSMEPRHGPQAGKSGHPRSQDTDSSPRAQGALELGFEAKPKGKCGAPRALSACGLGCHVAIDGAWAPPLPHAASTTARLDETLLHAEKNHNYARSLRPAVGLTLAINEERGKAPIARLRLLATRSFFFLLASPSCRGVHGTDEEVLYCREGEGP
jgi:hypothetical protein